MDSVSVTVEIVKLLTEITIAAEDILRRLAGHNDLERTVLSPARISLHKYRVWQQNWSGEGLDPNVTAEALWGVQGWKSIRRMLDEIFKASVRIGEYLDDIRGSHRTKPRSRWRTAARKVLSKQQSSESLKELRTLAAAVSKSVDQLWIYSETVFDSLHGILAHGTKAPEPEKLLRLALQSRAGSLDLHTLCSESTVDCCLEFDLLDTGSTFVDKNGPENSFGRLFYHLFAQARGSPQEIKEITVENIPEIDDSESVEDEVIGPNVPDLQLFKSQSGTGAKRIMVSANGSNPPSCLVLPRTIGTMQLDTKPDSLANLLTTLEQGANLSTVEHFSVAAKVELAYKVVECGFFLIGTPWFSSLSSKNILRLRNREQEHPTFILEVQTVDHHDLLLDDPWALAETSQLFRIGILLMEIALDEPNRSSRFEDHELDAERIISKLPLIEQSMGTQYCKATAFCLQPRQPKHRFQGPEKYQGKNFGAWESYLTEFLVEYHSQVFLRYVFRAISNSLDIVRALIQRRLQELRDVDTIIDHKYREKSVC